MSAQPVKYIDTPLLREVAKLLNATIMSDEENYIGMGGKCPECGHGSIMFNYVLIGCTRKECLWHEKMERYVENLRISPQGSNP